MGSNWKHSAKLLEIKNNNDYSYFVYESASPLVKNFNPTVDEIELLWASAGLTSEVGEVSAVIEKAIRKKGKIEQEDYDHLYDELSDVLFWLQSLLGCIPGKLDSLEELSKYNMEKLYNRVKAKEDKDAS